MSDLIDRDAAMKLRDTLADIIGAAPMSSIHSALSEYRKAIRALPAVEVGVKPLEWVATRALRKYLVEGEEIIEFTTRGPFLYTLTKNYRIGRSWSAYRGRNSPIAEGTCVTLEAAKAAAQADCAARIRSALTVTPDPRCAECDCANGGSDCTWIKTPAQEITVWYGSMPESNGKSNWTASLQRKSGDTHLDGFCFARSEYPDRVRYEADRVRWIIGERAEKPHILDYDAELHSGYVYPPAPDAAEIDLRAVMMEEIEKAAGLSPWVPPEYTMNEVVSDCCAFLRENREPAPDAEKVQALVEALEKINVGEGWAAKIARDALAAMKEGWGMDRKTMIGMASAALLVAQMGGNIPVHIGPSSPPRWSAANDTRKPPSGKNRAKVKAARKQRKATK